MPWHIGNRSQTHKLESCELSELLEICLCNERHDRRPLPQTQPIGQPKQPRKVPVVERDDDAAPPADVRPNGFEEPLNIRRVVEITVEQENVDGVGMACGVGELRRWSDALLRRVDGFQQQTRVARERIYMYDAVGVTGDSRDFPPDEGIGRLPKMPGKCETQTANAS